jgi:hypothetical protein
MHDIDRSYMENDQESFPFQAEDGPGQMEDGEVLSDGEVEQLAAELLSISNERDLDHFLGSLIKKAGSALGKFANSSLGKQIGGALKGIAKRALPIAGAALGNMIVPGLGGAIGGKLAGAAGSMFGLEVEGLSQEDQQFEVAKQFVRLAADTTKNALNAPTSNPVAAAQAALTQAAQRFAPGLLTGAMGRRASSGRWYRRGGNIVIVGA